MADINVYAETRTVKGKGASRRLRRERLVPAIVYGAEKEPESLTLKSNEVFKNLENEGFYSQIIMLHVDGAEPIRTVLRDIQRHPHKQQILHMDFQRVVAGQALQVTVPIHFLNEDTCVGVKTEGGIISRIENELTVECLPRNIPESLEVDLADLHVGEAIHMSDIKMPEGVTLVDFTEAGDESDRSIVSVHMPRVEAEPDEVEGGEVAPEEGVQSADDAGEKSGDSDD